MQLNSYQKTNKKKISMKTKFQTRIKKRKILIESAKIKEYSVIGDEIGNYCNDNLSRFGINCLRNFFAFTLVELMTVLTIIGLLIALLLPAVQVVRESARRINCQCNLKQMGIAQHSYFEVHGSYTAGAVGRRADFRPNVPSGGDGFHHQWVPSSNIDPALSDHPMGHVGVHIGWGLMLLPFLEQEGLYTAYDNNLWVDHPKNKQAVRTVLPVFLCPSAAAPQYTTKKGAQKGADGKITIVPYSVYSLRTNTMTTPNYTRIMRTTEEGKQPTDDNGKYFRCARSHYGGISVTYILHNYKRLPGDLGGNPNGMLYPICREYTNPVSEVSDGTSNTMMISEAYNNPDMAWSTATNLISQPQTIVLKPSHEDSAAGFQSCHPNGMNSLFVDSSIRFFSVNVDPFVLRCWINRMDGDVIPEP
jgi:type II secretory pathway pseudopilin PulG